MGWFIYKSEIKPILPDLDNTSEGTREKKVLMKVRIFFYAHKWEAPLHRLIRIINE
jgi:hypothetical protein